MKDALTNIDVYVLSRELTFKKLEKVVKVSNGYKFKAFPGRDLYYVSNLLIPTSFRLEGESPDYFCQAVNKYVKNAFLQSIKQINFDRVLLFEMEDFNIIFEFFHKGNVILTDKNWIILFARSYREWRHRKVLKGVMYTPPPAPRIHPNVSFEEFERIISGEPLRCLVKAGLPPIYAEEISSCESKEEMYEKFKELVSEMDSPKPCVVRDGEEIVDVIPFPVSSYEKYTLERKETFSEALDELTPVMYNSSPDEKKSKSLREYREKNLEDLKMKYKNLENMINYAYMFSSGLISSMELAKSGEAPRDVGPFRVKSWNRREIIYEFLPP